MSVTRANSRHLSFLRHLQDQNSLALGFLTPAAQLAYIERGRVTLARDNGDPVGYFLTSTRARRDVRIFQACVQFDARGLTHGLDMAAQLITEAAHYGSTSISLHCRDGLESNAFWQACGFALKEILPGGHARGRVVNVWHLDIAAALQLPTHPYAAAYLASLDPGGASRKISAATEAAAAALITAASRDATPLPAPVFADTPRIVVPAFPGRSTTPSPTDAGLRGLHRGTTQAPAILLAP